MEGFFNEEKTLFHGPLFMEIGWSHVCGKNPLSVVPCLWQMTTHFFLHAFNQYLQSLDGPGLDGIGSIKKLYKYFIPKIFNILTPCHRLHIRKGAAVLVQEGVSLLFLA